MSVVPPCGRGARAGWWPAAARLVLGAALSLAVGSGARAEPAAAAGGLRITLTPERPFVVLGTDADLWLVVDVVGPGAEALVPSRTFTTAGTLEAPRAAGPPGHYTARYVPPVERFPQVAQLVVEFASGAQRLQGVLRLPLYGTTEMPLRTSPAAQVTLRVADRAFGPEIADRLGHVKIPLEVPPGVRVGIARAVDRNGNVKETEVDLQPAPFTRVLIVAPPALEVGSFAEVAVLALDPRGAPAGPGRVSLRASEGLVHPLGPGGPGEARFLVDVPRRLGGGALALTGVVAGTPLGRADVAVPLLAGRPHTLTLSPTARHLVVGGGGQARVIVSAHDQFGNPTSADGARAWVDGVPAPLSVTPGGQGVITVDAPAHYAFREELTIDVKLGKAHAEQDIRLTGGPPTKLSLEVKRPWQVADGRRATELCVRSFDRNGTPTIVPGLSWVAPGGRIRRIRMAREGEYLADFIPDRASDPHREVISVSASQTLHAGGSLEVSPPPVWLLVGARFGFFSNLTHAAGPALFLEVLTPVNMWAGRLLAGLTVGYLRGDLTVAADSDTTTRVELNQVPVLALGRYRFAKLAFPELAVEAGAGASFAGTRITPDATVGVPAVSAPAWAIALQVGAEAAFSLKPGRLVVGARYLWIDLGRTSHGDNLRGNSAGLLGDLGYRMSW